MTYQKQGGDRYANYIGVNQRIQSAKKDILSVVTTDPILFAGSDVFGYVRATITLNDGRMATAIASFRLNATAGAQKTHPFEDAESSAIGRALAFLGYHVDKAIASAEEVQEAHAREEEDAQLEQERATAQSHKEKLELGRSAVREMIAECQAYGIKPDSFPKFRKIVDMSVDELRAFYRWMDGEIKSAQQVVQSTPDEDLDQLHEEVMATAAEMGVK